MGMLVVQLDISCFGIKEEHIPDAPLHESSAVSQVETVDTQGVSGGRFALSPLHAAHNVASCNVDHGRLFEFFGAQIPKMKLAHFDSKAALLAKAKEYMASCKNFRVAELARHLGMSETSVYGFFRNLGTTPINVKNEILLEEAKRLLCQTDLSVEQICGRVGFSSVAYFRKIVKESTGKNPLQLRRENSVESKI